MKPFITAIFCTALLAFATVAAAAQDASPAASPATSPAASPAPVKKAHATTRKTAATNPAADSKPMPATTKAETSRARQPAQEKKMKDCQVANKGKTGDDYNNAVSDCIKGADKK